MGCKGSKAKGPQAKKKDEKDVNGEIVTDQASDVAQPGVLKTDSMNSVKSTDSMSATMTSGSSMGSRKSRRRWSVADGQEDNSAALALSRVAAGHGGTSILKHVSADAEEVPDISPCVMKTYDETEAKVYQTLFSDPTDPFIAFVPQFYGEVDRDDLPEDLGEKERYMKLQNLLADLGKDPRVMDCKVGIRSFTEKECSNKKPRPDLYDRMVDLNPAAATDEEKAEGSITKFRWMTFNDELTTLKRLGFRVDGIANSSGKVTSKQLSSLKDLQDIQAAILKHFSRDGEGETTDRLQRDTFALSAAMTLVDRLAKMLEAMKASPFVRSHEIIGASLFFAMESNGSEANVYLIDFAKTAKMNPPITHEAEWKVGNHEDGLYIGMQNMITVWKGIVDILQQQIKAPGLKDDMLGG